MARPPERVNAELPEAVAGEGPKLGPIAWGALELHGGAAIEVRLGRPQSGPVVELRSQSALALPDALVYWCGAEPVDGELPAGAVLLGALGEHARRFALPEAARERSGWIVLYSLGHGEVAAAIPLER